jgi:hypothetical protein
LKDVTVTSYSGTKKIGSESGDMLFTHFGVSGPVILNLSSDIVGRLIKNEPVSISINFKSGYKTETLVPWLVSELKKFSRKTISMFMRDVMPSKLVPVFLGISGVMADKQCSSITPDEVNKLSRSLTDFRIEISGSLPIEAGIITRGGVPLDEINPYTMESKIVKGLYFCGEIIDIDGKTGGYNLQLAFSTAFLASKSQQHGTYYQEINRLSK